MPAWATSDPKQFWKAADKHERANGAVYREHEIALPDELTQEQQRTLVIDLVTNLVGDKTYQYAVHGPKSSLEGATNTHLHLMFSDRLPDGLSRPPERMFSRYNAEDPSLGGCRKDGGGRSRLKVRDDLISTRKLIADRQNAALEKYGYDARVDHRSLKEQGIDRKPERHLGPARIKRMSAHAKAEYVAARHGTDSHADGMGDGCGSQD